MCMKCQSEVSFLEIIYQWSSESGVKYNKLPVPRIHSTLGGALERCGLCCRTSLSSLTTTPVVVPVKLRASLIAACPKKIKEGIKTLLSTAK